MTRRNKIVALGLAIVIFFAMMLSVTVSAHDRDHECVGIGCDICLQMESARQILKMLISGTLTVAFTLALTYASFQLIHRLAQCLPQGTLIALKVELLN